MGRKREIPKIRIVTVNYNGNKTKFEIFMQSMISDFLSSDRLTKSSGSPVIDKVEFIHKTA